MRENVCGLRASEIDAQALNASRLTFDNFRTVSLYDKRYTTVLRCAVDKIQSRLGIPVSAKRPDGSPFGFRMEKLDTALD